MRTIISFFLVAILTGGSLTGQKSGNNVVDAILSGYSAKQYSTEPVTDQQLDLILKCGIKAPSSTNKQPWKFTVIKDEQTMKEMINDVVPGNVLIIISGLEQEAERYIAEFDCGLATHSMFLAATGLGLGARIYGSPVRIVSLNRESYQIPAGYNPVMILRVGNIDKGVDAVSAASTRKAPEEVINYKK